MSQLGPCQYCSKKNFNALNRCRRCNIVYCKSHWKKHKKLCNDIVAVNKSNDSNLKNKIHELELALYSKEMTIECLQYKTSKLYRENQTLSNKSVQYENLEKKVNELQSQLMQKNNQIKQLNDDKDEIQNELLSRKPLQSKTSMSKQCGFCSKQNASKRCSRCKMSYYCNGECQSNHWKIHKKTCIEAGKKRNDQQNESLQSVLMQKNNIIKQLNAEKDKIEKQLFQKTMEYHALEDRLKDLYEFKEKYKTVLHETEIQKTTICEMEQNINNKEKENMKLLNGIKAYKSQIYKFKQKYKTALHETEIMEERIYNTEKENMQLLDDIKEYKSNVKKTRKQYESVCNERDGIKNELFERKEANMRQRMTIKNSFNEIEEYKKNIRHLSQNQEPERGKKIKDDLKYLEMRLNEFIINYDKNKLIKIYENSPDSLMVNDKMDAFHLSLSSFGKHLLDIESYIESLWQPDIRKYKKWNIDKMIKWISLLEQSKYLPIIDKLRRGLEESQIFCGDLLPELTRSDLSNPPFNIKEFIIKRDLIQHFKSLKIQNNNNNNDVAQMAFVNNENNEGADTAYIDR